MAARGVLNTIRTDLETVVGERIRVKANRGRRKIVEREGVLEKTYPSIFVIKLDRGPHSGRRISFSYTDVLTEVVELHVYDENGEHKFETSVKQAN